MPSTGELLSDQERVVLGNAVRAARINAGFRDLKALADSSGISRKTLGKLENGHPVQVSTINTIEQRIGWAPNEWQSHTKLQQISGRDDKSRGELRIEQWRAQERRRGELIALIGKAGRDLAAAAEELARLETGELRADIGARADVVALPAAAYETGSLSYREQLDAVQDEAAEAPDAPGSEHGS